MMMTILVRTDAIVVRRGFVSFGAFPVLTPVS